MRATETGEEVHDFQHDILVLVSALDLEGSTQTLQLRQKSLTLFPVRYTLSDDRGQALARLLRSQRLLV